MKIAAVVVGNLCDPAVEYALCEVDSMRQFAGLKLDSLPDETTIPKFRHFLEQHGLCKVFKEVNKHLERNGLMLREGCIVDVTIISAPSSTPLKTKRANETESSGRRKCIKAARATKGTSG